MQQNISELISAAKSGDIEAMEQISALYEANGDAESAVWWNNVCLNTRYADATILTLIMSMMSAMGSLAIGAWDEVESSCLTVMDRVNEIKEMIDNEEVYITESSKKQLSGWMVDAQYGLANVAFWRDRDFVLCINRLEKVKKTSAKAGALFGVCCVEMDDLKLALYELEKVYEDREYAAFNKNSVDEIVYATGMLYLADIYRIGLPGIRASNSELAVKVLKDTLAVVKDADFRFKLQNELDRYKKRFFWGYKYI